MTWHRALFFLVWQQTYPPPLFFLCLISAPKTHHCNDKWRQWALILKVTFLINPEVGLCLRRVKISAARWPRWRKGEKKRKRKREWGRGSECLWEGRCSGAFGPSYRAGGTVRASHHEHRAPLLGRVLFVSPSSVRLFSAKKKSPWPSRGRARL